ncbi:MAG TPA: aconitate hydratase [Casimicrobiaceae bacterium]|nr:aconitate hydratase [Casimicrobiaceae bacterium]
MAHNRYQSLQQFRTASGASGSFYSLPALEKAGVGRISRLPVSVRIVLESVLRNCDGRKITETHVRQLAGWSPNAPRTEEIPFVVARVVLQDFTGVPLLCDLAAMRGVAQRMGKDPKVVEPLVPVDLVVDHSVQVDHYGTKNALDLNMKIEFKRNAERYKFMKWGMQAFDTFKVVPPGIGIVHQVNLEYLARGVHQKDGICYPDTLVGTDSHTTMINGIGVVGWGVGGIEAEAGMLGQPVYFLTPDVVGVYMKGALSEGVTATDLVLTVTELLRKTKVVGKFVEFFGPGAASLPVPDRATIGNMAPEYGATMGFFPVDEKTVDYLAKTGRTREEIEAFEAYFRAQGLFGAPAPGAIDYSQTVEFDLATVTTSLAGPKRPQDRIPLGKMKEAFETLFSKPVAENGFNQPVSKLARRFPTKLMSVSTAPSAKEPLQLPDHPKPRDFVEMVENRPTPDPIAPKTATPVDLGNGDVLIAAITSCTNTSNPGVLLGAGLLAKKAAATGLRVKPYVKTSLAPGSRVVTEYLEKSNLLPELEKLGFYLAGYGCTTCIGNAGPLDPSIEETIGQNDLVCAAVLSGNRNFEARIHPSIKANFLASPPLVVAFAIAGRVNIDLSKEPLGKGGDGADVFLRDIWPTSQEIGAVMQYATDPATYRRLYSDFTKDNPLWNSIPSSTGQVYAWDRSTYIAEPPFFKDFTMQPGVARDIHGARVLGIFGDSVTTDHISPAGSIKPTSPAGIYLQEHDVAVPDFNSYGSRRGNHEVMMRGTFANVRIKNLMLPAKPDGSRVEGGVTILQPAGTEMPIYDAAMAYIGRGTPTIVFAGEEYGTGSSRDWAAKGTQLLGVKAVVARSFERIHRSNLVGMGVLPCQFKGNDSAASLGLRGDEEFDVTGIEGGIKPQMDVTLTIRRRDGSAQKVPLLLRIDTPIEVDYYLHGGILPYVLRELLAA